MIIGRLYIGIIKKYKKPVVLAFGIGQPIFKVLSVFI